MNCIICYRVATYSSPNYLCTLHWNQWFRSRLTVPDRVVPDRVVPDKVVHEPVKELKVMKSSQPTSLPPTKSEKALIDELAAEREKNLLLSDVLADIWLVFNNYEAYIARGLDPSRYMSKIIPKKKELIDGVLKKAVFVYSPKAKKKKVKRKR